jgi:heme-degrading monooxygenase HmoA
MLSEMICVNDRFLVSKARRHSFEERLQLFTRLMNMQRGLVGLRAVPPGKGNAPYVVESTWLSRGHFQNWIDSPAFVLSIGALCGNAADPIVRSKQTEVLSAHDILFRPAA